jgi:hypothetical protein
MKSDLNSHSPAFAAWLRVGCGSLLSAFIPSPDMRVLPDRRCTATHAAAQAVPI